MSHKLARAVGQTYSAAGLRLGLPRPGAVSGRAGGHSDPQPRSNTLLGNSGPPLDPTQRHLLNRLSANQISPVTQLDDIITAATNADSPLPVVLRKLLVFSYELGNDRLTQWVNAELDGYDDVESLPDYRKIRAGAIGTLYGPFGAMQSNRPIPAIILDPKHRHWAREAPVMNSVANIEETAAAGGGTRAWPADLIYLYQDKIIEGMALVSAGQPMPKQVFVSILDTVRTRALRFALDLRRTVRATGDELAAISPEKVDQKVTNIIYGGNVVIGGNNHRFNQTGSMTVGAGDQTALTVALAQIGFTSTEIAELYDAMKQDKAEDPEPGIGKRAASWLGKIGTVVGTAALSVSTDVAKLEANKALTSYFGLG